MAVNQAEMNGTLGVTTRGSAVRRKATSSLAPFGYLGLVVLLLLGWNLRDRLPVDPESGAGYWLGIIGASMMVILLIYPLRKRVRWLKVIGPTKHWFRFHMMLGLGGPLLVLYHCKFQVHAINSSVALYSMLVVAGSGIVGRYFYTRIHRGLYGKKTSLKELRAELVSSQDRSQGIAALMPNVLHELEKLSGEMQEDEITHSVGVGRSVKWPLRKHKVHLSLYLMMRRELRAIGEKSPALATHRAKLQRSASRYISNYLKLIGQVAQFSFYERLFSLWHVFHLPLFFIMVLAAIVHVLAVHMY